MTSDKDRYKPETRAAYEKTLDEVKAGCMRGPYTVEQIVEKHGNCFNVIRRFGIRQGSEEKIDFRGLPILDTNLNPIMVPRYRAIDNHTESGNNDTAIRRHRVLLVAVHFLLILVRFVANFFSASMWEAGDGDPCGGSDNVRGA